MEFIFSNIWTFLGTVLLIYVVGEAIINPICRIFYKNKDN